MLLRSGRFGFVALDARCHGYDVRPVLVSVCRYLRLLGFVPQHQPAIRPHFMFNYI